MDSCCGNQYESSSKKLNVELSDDPAIPLLDIHLKEWKTETRRDICTPVNPVSIDSMCVLLSCFSRVQLFATPWTVAHQASLSIGFSRQEHLSGLLCPPPEDLLDLGIELSSLMSPALAGGFLTTSATWEAPVHGQRNG